MAYPTYQARAEGIDARTIEYGYGMDDIQRASERLDRSSTLEHFTLSQQFKDTLRRIPGAFNQRGMLDSGQHKRARERAYGAQQMAQMGALTMQEEARLQLDRQRSMLEENLYGGLESDAIANAMRRLTLTQALQGIV